MSDGKHLQIYSKSHIRDPHSARTVPAWTEAETAVASLEGEFDSSSSRLTRLSAYGQETVCYYDRKPMRISRVPWLLPERLFSPPLFNLDCEGLGRLPLVLGLGSLRRRRVTSELWRSTLEISFGKGGLRSSSRDGKSSLASPSQLVWS